MKLAILALAALAAAAQSFAPASDKPLRISVDDITYTPVPQLYVVAGTGISYSTSYANGKYTLTINAATDANQAANLIKAGPASGADAAPTYRALVAADMPYGVLIAAGGTVIAVTASSTKYSGVYGSPSMGAGNTTVQSVIPFSCTASTAYLYAYGAQPADGSLIFTLQKNGSDTAIVITMAANSTAGLYSDTAHTVAVTAGDRLNWKIVNASTSTGAAISSVSFLCK